MMMASGLEDDLTQLNNLTEETILERLKNRYDKDIIYTKVSDILIALNPCKPVPLYDTTDHEEYRWDNYDEGAKPHVFDVAAAAYRRMRDSQLDQVIIVSGESGAGKTESAKYMVKHMVHMCQQGDTVLHDKIIKVNPLLEAFGNAKTIMNLNSSRYAKFLEIHFQENGQLQGAVVRDYMLEKARVCYQTKGEGIFHIFYYLFAGAPRNKLEELSLTGQAGEYRIMRSDPSLLDRHDENKKKYEETVSTLKQINVDVDLVLRMLAAVIHITDVTFSEADNGAAEIDDAAPYVYAADLLDLNEETFAQSLITNKMDFRGQEIVKYKSVKQAEDSRDALAKMLYERTFGWLVRSVNQDLHPSKKRSGQDTKIGILDIAGFEKLESNSFEQMCINVVNEKLQNHTNTRLFSVELSLYRDEGIDVEGINFKNNQETLDLFTKPKVGLLAILDEQTKFQQGSDLGFVQALDKKFNDNAFYQRPRGDRPGFGIQHFAGLVVYDAVGFLEKNRDTLNADLLEVMKESNDEFISDLFTVKRGPTGTISSTFKNLRASRMSRKGGVRVLPKTDTKKGKQLAMELGQTLTRRYGEIQQPTPGVPEAFGGSQTKKKVSTLASYFEQSLMELVEKLNEAEPFFVRCLKPNQVLQPDQFDSHTVSDQLRYNGIAAVAAIRKMGFSVRKKYSDFNPMYAFVLQNNDKKLTKKEMARKILLQTPADYHGDFRCGKSKAFMKERVELWLKKIKALTEKRAAVVINRTMKAFHEKEEKRRKDEERRRKEEERRRKEEEEKSVAARKRKENDAEGSDGSTAGPNSPVTITGSIRPPKLSESVSNGNTTGSSSDSDTSDDDTVVNPPSPPMEHDMPSEDQADNPKKNDDTPIAFWDIPQIIHREKKKKDVHEERSLQVIKVITYFILFCVLLFCAVSQKLSLMILVSPQYHKYTNRSHSVIPAEGDEENTFSARYLLLLIAMLIPYGLTFLTSIFKWLFGSMPNPTLLTIFFTALMETLHTVGLCLLCFRVLPEMDMVGGIMIMSAVTIMPTVLKPLCSSEPRYKENNRSMKNKIGSYVCDVVAIVVQVIAIPVVVSDQVKYMVDYPDTNGNDNGEIYLIVETAFALFLISFSWWENFMDDRFCGTLRATNSWHTMVLKIKFDLQECRPIISTFTSCWKIILSILLAWLLRMKTFEQFYEAFDTLYGEYLINNSAILTLTLAGFVGHYVAYTACKLQLQIFSFVIPLILSTPIAVVIAILDCTKEYDLLGVFTHESRSCVNVWIGQNDKDAEATWWTPDGDEHRWWHLLFGAAWMLSVYWVGRHIFYPRQERLAKTERLFLNPYYCGILLEQHLVLNRRRHNRKVKRDIKEDKIIYRLSQYDTKMNVEGQEEDNLDGSKDTASNDPYNKKFKDVPTIYACATMWHENRNEMTQLMKSIFRMDRDQCLRRHAEIFTGKKDPEFYDFEAHILYDDAMEMNDDGEWIPNQFVKLTLEVMEIAASSVYEKKMAMKPPIKIPSPYGGQLVWEMPGNNFLFLHMKDKQKIRHRKRWSQVMYMYYLLGFRIIRHCQEKVTAALNSNRLNELGNWDDNMQANFGQIGKSHIFQTFDEEVQRKAANTFILALDGDVDFTPGAVRLLLDRMRKSEKVGAACGRIHPIGSGPIVWFQKFEYATAHWLQKATEHVLGCVLCSPGCFSLFRGSALMDDNVMKKYTIRPTEASHHLMYDQGEDRWLCTLLLQQGYRVDYAAASDAYTYAPEGFAEFFNQRRRWMPSTVANIADLLADYRNTVYINSNISMLYIFYQAALLLSTVVGPATVLMMIASASLIVFKVDLLQGYLISLLPAIFYFIVCMTMKTKWQLLIAELLSGIYAFIMMIVLVGTIVTAAQESPFHPSVLFMAVLVLIFALAALLHPREWSCATYGILYYLMVPTGFLLLIIYSICNLHVVSWGTREVPKKKTKAQEEEEKRIKEEKEKKKKEQGFFGRFFPQSPMKELKDIIAKITDIQSPRQPIVDNNTRLLEKINDGISTLVRQQAGDNVHLPSHVIPEVQINMEEPVKGILKEKEEPKQKKKKSTSFSNTATVKTGSGEIVEEAIYDKLKGKEKRDELKNPFWSDDKDLGNGETMEMLDEEKQFWENFIKKYLAPLVMTDSEKKATHKGLIKLRNDVALGFCMINLMWIALNFMFQLSSPTKVQIPLSSPKNEDDFTEDDETDADNALIQVDILGLLFIFFFAVVLVIQFFGMIIHRWGTFLHLVSITELRNPLGNLKEMERRVTRQEIEIIKEVLEEPTPDYPMDSDDETDKQQQTAGLKQDLKRLMTTGTRSTIMMNPDGKGVLGTSTRQLGVSRRSPLDLTAVGTILGTGLKVTSRFDTTPGKDNLRRQLQDEMRKAKDTKYKDRELPPIKDKRRLNTTAGQAGLMKIMKERNLHVRFMDPSQVTDNGVDRPIIQEGSDDNDYDFIPGTIGRELGKKFKLLAKANQRPRRPSSTLY